jgi:hypothetical protein
MQASPVQRITSLTNDKPFFYYSLQVFSFGFYIGIFLKQQFSFRLYNRLQATRRCRFTFAPLGKTSIILPLKRFITIMSLLYSLGSKGCISPV